MQRKIIPLHSISTTKPFIFLMVFVGIFIPIPLGVPFGKFFVLRFGVPRSIYAETSFSATRIIYGVTDISSSPKRPYPAFTQAADTEVSLSSFCVFAGRQCCLSAIPIPLGLSLTHLREVLAALYVGFPLRAKRGVPRNPNYSVVKVQESFYPLTLYSTLF